MVVSTVIQMDGWYPQVDVTYVLIASIVMKNVYIVMRSNIMTTKSLTIRVCGECPYFNGTICTAQGSTVLDLMSPPSHCPIDDMNAYRDGPAQYRHIRCVTCGYTSRSVEQEPFKRWLYIKNHLGNVTYECADGSWYWLGVCPHCRDLILSDYGDNK